MSLRATLGYVRNTASRAERMDDPSSWLSQRARGNGGRATALWPKESRASAGSMGKEASARGGTGLPLLVPSSRPPPQEGRDRYAPIAIAGSEVIQIPRAGTRPP